MRKKDRFSLFSLSGSARVKTASEHVDEIDA
jgi:hypothetical protein